MRKSTATIALLSPLLALGPTLTAAPAAANPRSGVATGDGHLVVVISSPSEGLEAGIPRDSWYARAIALDRQGKYAESYNAYRKARSEFKKMLADRPHWAKVIRGWILKAEFQKSQSSRLKPRVWSYAGRSMTYYRAVALHNKWLGIRAFSGEAPRKLAEAVIRAYQQVISRYRHHDQAHIALAAMLHELGRHAEAERTFARVQYPGRSYYSKDIAYYYTAAGKPEEAFKHLKRAVKYSSSFRTYALRCNDFDRLRSDERFHELIGEP
jgi:tetratricopeptide (TPR) repeat protein